MNYGISSSVCRCTVNKLKSWKGNRGYMLMAKSSILSGKNGPKKLSGAICEFDSYDKITKTSLAEYFEDLKS